MTYPRAHLVDQTNGGYYHCISRCVRQAWLCGTPKGATRSFEHRKRWIEDRLRLLTRVFAVDVYAYAIMSNHYHLVLRLDPKRTASWADEDVIRRWRQRKGIKRTPNSATGKSGDPIAPPKRLSEIRRRLGSLSWFMREINEPLARLANKEDRCSGRFWEGRFKSIALLDQSAIVNCMVYVDLNPARANPSQSVPSQYTSALERTKPAGGFPADVTELGITEPSYQDLVLWSARRPKHLVAQPDKPYLAELLNTSASDWATRLAANQKKYRAYGTLSALKTYCAALNQRWLKAPLLRALEAPT